MHVEPSETDSLRWQLMFQSLKSFPKNEIFRTPDRRGKSYKTVFELYFITFINDRLKSIACVYDMRFLHSIDAKMIFLERQPFLWENMLKL